MGYLVVLLRHARRALPTYFCFATLQPWPHTRRRRLTLESDLHVNSRCHGLQGTLRPAFLPGFRGEYHPNWLYDNSEQLLYAARTVRTPVLVVQFHRSLHHHRRRVELRVRTNHVRRAKTLAVHLPPRRLPNLPLRLFLLLHPKFLRRSVVSDEERTSRRC